MIRKSIAVGLIIVAGVLGCNKPSTSVDKSTATLMMFSNASQAMSARVLPSVIRLDVSYQRQPVSDQLEEVFGAAITQPQIGSGVIISKDGLALTNYHVVRGAQVVKVTLMDGRQAKAEILGTDALTDLALLRLPLDNLTATDWSDSDRAYAGSLVWSFGSPFGKDGSIGLGVISSSLRSLYSDNPYHDFIQTDASINPGSSGGPLIDASGRILGINTSIAGDQFAGVGYAIPSNIARTVAKQLEEHGKIDRAWIGVELAAISQDEAILAGRANVAGAVIRRFVKPSTPAETSGLKAGDLLLEINTEKVFSPTQAMRLIAGSKLEEPLKVLVQRKSDSLTIDVLPTIRPN